MKKNMKKNNNEKGFTLIELLVVIAVIGLLSSIVLASLSSARARSRDAKRIAEMRSVESALHLYALNNNGNIPMSMFNNTPPMINGRIDCATAYANTDNLYETLIQAKALSSRPIRDLSMEAKGYCYVYLTDYVAVSGAMYDNADTKHNLLAGTVISTKSRSGVFATALETRKTSAGYNAFTGIDYGDSNFVLNVNLTEGIDNGSGSYGGSGSN